MTRVDLLLRPALALSLVWLAARSAQAAVTQPEGLAIGPQVAGYVAEARRLRSLTCGVSGVTLAYYPAGTYSAWFSGLAPVAGYVYLWPWVAEVGLQAVEDALARPDALAVVVLHEDVVWGKYKTRDYLKPLFDLADRQLVHVEKDVYLTPALAARCGWQQGSNASTLGTLGHPD